MLFVHYETKPYDNSVGQEHELIPEVVVFPVVYNTGQAPNLGHFKNLCRILLSSIS